MSDPSDRWIHDSRGQKLPLRPDPEGIWHPQRSFRINITTGDRLIKKHPRVAVVLAMRELPGLEFRPELFKERRNAYIVQIIMGIAVGAAWYYLLLGSYFGLRNGLAIAITIFVTIAACLISLGQRWRRANRRLEEINTLLSEHPIHCPACWYPIERRYEPDGCIICPECGGAWELPPASEESSSQGAPP